MGSYIHEFVSRYPPVVHIYEVGALGEPGNLVSVLRGNEARECIRDLEEEAAADLCDMCRLCRSDRAGAGPCADCDYGDEDMARAYPI